MRFDIYRERERTYTVEKWVVVGEGQLYAIQFAEHCAATFSLSLSAVCIFDRGDMARQWGVISYADHVISALKNQHWPLGSLIFFLSYQSRSCLLPVHTKLSLSLSLSGSLLRGRNLSLHPPAKEIDLGATGKRVILLTYRHNIDPVSPFSL